MSTSLTAVLTLTSAIVAANVTYCIFDLDIWVYGTWNVLHFKLIPWLSCKQILIIQKYKYLPEKINSKKSFDIVHIIIYFMYSLIYIVYTTKYYQKCVKYEREVVFWNSVTISDAVVLTTMKYLSRRWQMLSVLQGWQSIQ